MKIIELKSHPRVQATRVKRCELHILHKAGGCNLFFPSDEQGNVDSTKLEGHQLANFERFQKTSHMYAEPELIVRHVVASVQAAYDKKAAPISHNAVMFA